MVMNIGYLEKAILKKKMGNFHLRTLLQSSIPLLKVVYMNGV
jgi:hypothetical protein